jgi:hypothetical protein
MLSPWSEKLPFTASVSPEFHRAAAAVDVLAAGHSVINRFRQRVRGVEVKP